MAKIKSEKFCDELWAKLKPARRKGVNSWILDAFQGGFGTTKEEILEAAEEDFGDLPDWGKILPILMAYLPMLLSLLKKK